MELLTELAGFLEDHLGTTLAAAIGSLITAATGLFTFHRRPRKVSQGEARYLTDRKLLSAPIRRPAYSDRMAYILAEMSALAYYPFEGPGQALKDAAKGILARTIDNAEDLEAELEELAERLLFKGIDSREFFRKTLESSGFDLLGTIDVQETQGFVCRRSRPEVPYVVVAFRGTEKRVSDWLTDARAIPRVTTGPDGKEIKVHDGFCTALTELTDETGRTVLDHVRGILAGPEARDEQGNPLPVFLTGHSLGGALALLTTKLVAPDVTGACYTFGGPRVANYEYFDGVKTPVFRVVNSADIVPRVPPGAGNVILVNLARGLSWATSLTPPLSRLFDRMEAFFDKLNGYRHFGDLRYLTDVEEGRFFDVKLLSNPPVMDRIMWTWHHLAASIRRPIQSHGMEIYRRKLDHIANARFTH